MTNTFVFKKLFINKNKTYYFYNYVQSFYYIIRKLVPNYKYGNFPKKELLVPIGGGPPMVMG